MTRPAIDVSDLTTYGFGHRSVAWWGTMGLVAIEGAVFALMIVNYFYLKGRSPHWPPGFHPPDMTWGTINTVVLLASVIPNQLTKSAAEKMDVAKVRIWLPLALIFAVAFSLIRIFEFQSLNVWWDSNAYGSAVWTLMGLHTAHLFDGSCRLGGPRPSDVHRPVERNEAGGRERERALLVFRRAVVAADLCRHLHRTAHRMTGRGWPRSGRDFSPARLSGSCCSR